MLDLGERPPDNAPAVHLADQGLDDRFKRVGLERRVPEHGWWALEVGC